MVISLTREKAPFWKGLRLADLLHVAAPAHSCKYQHSESFARLPLATSKVAAFACLCLLDFAEHFV